ncbi:MAG: MEDS domain-containing protein [Candidatus Omnitrophica bacterium]|nr:MEDS domain-containing protein [Candidatus Omnitrophota bacterium]MBU1853080.1 MEDS domain-containing protein [Candidatus Omnitrophota bacterium]
MEHTPSNKHTCLFYSSKDELLDILVPYFKAGLENNEFCIWVPPESLKVEEARLALSESVKNLNYYIEKGQIEIYDYRDYYLKSGVFLAFEMLDNWGKKEQEILRKGFDKIRVAGDGSWGLEGSWVNLIYYEEAVNSIIAVHPIISICSYNIARLSVDKIMAIGANHQSSLVKRMGSWDSLSPAEFKK